MTESSERLRSPWSGVHPWWWCPSTQHRQGGNMHQCYWGEQINDEREASSLNHVTFSSHFPQSNGEAVKTIKSLRKKSTDLYLTLMAYPVASLVKGPQSSCWWGTCSCHVIPAQPRMCKYGELEMTEQRYRGAQWCLEKTCWGPTSLRLPGAPCKEKDTMSRRPLMTNARWLNWDCTRKHCLSLAPSVPEGFLYS